MLKKQRSVDFEGAAGIGPQRATTANSRSENAGQLPAEVGQVPAEILDQLLDPAVFCPGLEQYARATHVAVQLFDVHGKPIGACLNPQALWSLLKRTEAAEGGCAFGLSSKSCTCFADACQQGNTVYARDHMGLVHFAVPLLVEQRVLGGILAGQVFDQYPETLLLDRAARDSNLSPQQVWSIARQAHPMSRARLEVYADLLTTLANALLQARYKSILEAQRQEELRQAQKLESIGILAGGVAHDFNNLLTGVLGNASLILNDLPLGHAAGARAQDICAAAQRAAGLTRQLLAYSGKGRFDIQPVDLSRLVRDTTKLIHLSIPKWVSLRLDLAETLPAIEADASQIQQIIMNLVINGAEAIGTDNHGTVIVRTGVQDLDSASIRRMFSPAIEPGRFVFVEVQDTGCGMDEFTLARIFDPFFTTKFTGRGLGLAALSGIVRGHNGTMKVSSALGQGATFKVLFPASAKKPANVHPYVERTSQQGSGTILVVDDDPIVRKIATIALERSGYTVLSAEDGETAIELFQQQAVGEVVIVLLDMTMPGLSGYETFLQLKQIRPGVNVLLTSGYNEVEITQPFAGLGLAGFIQKPYTAAALTEKIKAILRIALLRS